MQCDDKKSINKQIFKLQVYLIWIFPNKRIIQLTIDK